ncbi:3-oxoacyl-[acyl-carrier-protein] reductase FabG [Variibacter gotjawalensis]|uniref:3-oxoacyl-[acyl-carrier-protein] reductase FabG n=1 Tax=Variibacter gotjawalensis TaxID=1333996 RepID=A0A0S3PVT4_9BRAD|nr:SDR family oxidoreductase [Variibacter gotjawalensis]NIK45872.1 NAD(P)-dependent dehydrogenase (short-subunit alcohol dehydrogenase family) [Variibacter gotjawalensis]RZS47795.1 NAD(P)-dependent dehydrogenase (short-subunit alcohol dehydrogenase family) [Variibacter gotjawalensis]BAT60049.1 3-oxoacyl-[acyl-carrier-protein] reductase FabG [Variibacter gotjawalensis]
MNTRNVSALVTGGSGAIGRALIEKLSANGTHVVNIDRAPPSTPLPGEFVKLDLTDLTATQKVMGQVMGDFSVGWLVNNAGIATPATLEDTTLQDLDDILSVNLRAALIATQAAIPGMKAARKGRIVNITSRAALGKELRTAYAAAKAGLIGMTRTWALELAPHGITVNAVGPGPIATPLFNSANPPDSPRTKAIIEGIPVKRVGTPDDIAHAVSFFLSDDAGYITGQTLFVCGGLTIGTAPIGE